LRGSAPGIELINGQEFDRCDAQFLKVRNLLDHAEIGTSVGRSHPGVGVARESRYMHFIDDASTKRSIEGLISFPIERA
jgi:hypothetical protein